MLILLIVLSSLLGLLFLLFLLWLLLLSRPQGRRPEDARLLCEYAHRGLHDGNVGDLPENSIAAFSLACEKGYGIELDVQLSSDGAVMVFHDATLKRMTGVDRRVCELTEAELCALSLAGTEQRIPTFRQVLETVNGRVPILVELKGESFDTSLCPKVAEILSEYEGPFCVESFNPLLLKDFRRYMPKVYRGLLYTNACRDKKKCTVINMAVTAMLLNFLAKPQFIAYNKIDRASFPVKLTTGLFRAPRFVWTVKGERELAEARSCGECAIFERQ